jgi:hypothetical protein
MKDIGHSIAFRLRGHKSNRDAIGTAITVEVGNLRQTKYLQAGTGFLAQHSKEVFFGVGKPEGAIRATVRWPSGLSQQFEHLPVNHRIEIEEGSAAFVAKPFAAPAPAYAQAGPPPALDPLPFQVETWLIEPLKLRSFPCRTSREACESCGLSELALCSSTSGRQPRRFATNS